MQTTLCLQDTANASECLSALNLKSSVSTAREVIKLALAGAKRPIVTTKFGPGSAALLQLVAEQSPHIPVVWVDTGYNTRATNEFAQELHQLLNLNLQTYHPVKPWSGWIPEPGEPNHALFVHAVKLEPFARALSDLQPDAWFTGLRRTQTAHRSTQHHFNHSKADLVKVCPLIHWSDDDITTFLDSDNLPAEPDYFDPAKGNANRECGLHLNF